MQTTLVAIETADGVVVGTDSRTTAGQYISSRATDKITVLTDHIVMLRSGSASDSQAIADIVMYYAESESLVFFRIPSYQFFQQINSGNRQYGVYTIYGNMVYIDLIYSRWGNVKITNK